MLLTNQRIDKLTAFRIYLTTCHMLDGPCLAPGVFPIVLPPPHNHEYDAVDGPRALASVSLARNRGKPTFLIVQVINTNILLQHASTPGKHTNLQSESTSQISQTISTNFYFANAILTIHFLPGTKIFHSAQFSTTKSPFTIQPTLPTLPQATIQGYVACTNNVYNRLQTGDRVLLVTTVFSLKKIQNWMECEACTLCKFSCSYPLPLVTSPTRALSFNGLSSLVMPHVVTQGCG